MIHKRYEFEDKDIEFWCPETAEENEQFNRLIEKIELIAYFMGK